MVAGNHEMAELEANNLEMEPAMAIPVVVANNHGLAMAAAMVVVASNRGLELTMEAGMVVVASNHGLEPAMAMTMVVVANNPVMEMAVVANSPVMAMAVMVGKVAAEDIRLPANYHTQQRRNRPEEPRDTSMDQ